MLSIPPAQIGRISILTRNPVPMAEGHPHVTVITHSDFGSYPQELLDQLKGAEGCVWAVGTPISMVDRDEYVRITVDYPVAAAKAFSTLSDNFKFVYVSGEGATDKPGPFSPPFAPIKAQAESALLSLPSTHPSLRPFVLRPGFVDASPQPTLASFIPARPQPLLKKLIPVLGPVYRTLYPGGTAPTTALGRVLCEVVMGDGGRIEGDGVEGDGRIVRNWGMRRLAGL
ncbi:MAG: hypothetical protein M1840_001545 [Geoglossum simile]|nr:MAG: hypothetical protein M1840_001545 [Geoglossum simile]